MTLKHPFKISARLLPALEIGGAWIQLEHVGNAGGRRVYRWTIDLPDGKEFSGSDLKSGVGVGGAKLQEVFVTLLCFLGAAAEGGSNRDLFPRAVVAWAMQNDDEISMLRCDIEESLEPLIIE